MKKVLEYFKKTIKKIKDRKKEVEKVVKGGHPEEASEVPKENLLEGIQRSEKDNLKF